MALKRKVSSKFSTSERAAKTVRTAPCSRESSASPVPASSKELSSSFSPEFHDSQQEEVIARYQNIAQQSVDWFVDNCLAKVDDERVSIVFGALKNLDNDGLTEDGRVQAFSTRSPSQMRVTKKEVQKTFSQFIQNILDNDPEKVEICNFLTFKHSIGEGTSTDADGVSTARAFGYGHLGAVEDWADVFLAEEFKLKSASPDVNQVSSSFSHSFMRRQS